MRTARCVRILGKGVVKVVHRCDDAKENNVLGIIFSLVWQNSTRYKPLSMFYHVDKAFTFNYYIYYTLQCTLFCTEENSKTFREIIILFSIPI